MKSITKNNTVDIANLEAERESLSNEIRNLKDRAAELEKTAEKAKTDGKADAFRSARRALPDILDELEVKQETYKRMTEKIAEAYREEWSNESTKAGGELEALFQEYEARRAECISVIYKIAEKTEKALAQREDIRKAAGLSLDDLAALPKFNRLDDIRHYIKTGDISKKQSYYLARVLRLGEYIAIDEAERQAKAFPALAELVSL